MDSQRRIPVLPVVAVVVGATGYVLTFYVRSAMWPAVGAMLMLLAAGLAFGAIARSRRPLAIVLAVLGAIPLAFLVLAVVVWLNS